MKCFSFKYWTMCFSGKSECMHCYVFENIRDLRMTGKECRSRQMAKIELLKSTLYL